MSKWFAAIVLVCATIGIAVYLYPSSQPHAAGHSHPVSTGLAANSGRSTNPSQGLLPASSPSDPVPSEDTGAQSLAIVAPQSPPAAAPTLADATPAPEPGKLAPVIVLENMRTTIRQYGLKFGGNPVGTNPEITKALAGDNPQQINFLKADGNRVNQKGELVDPWGTPYFFHQLSAKEMEIRSAGPDGVMWTADDLVIR